jgi:hypothetical protein
VNIGQGCNSSNFCVVITNDYAQDLHTKVTSEDFN